MKQSWFTEEHMIGSLKSVEAGQKRHTHGISEATDHRWKTTYGRLEAGEARRLKQLDDEHRQLKQLVADLTLDNSALETGGGHLEATSRRAWLAARAERG